MKIKFANGSFPIGACRDGAVVQTSTFTEDRIRVPNPKGFAHIIGFGYNSQSELLIKIRTSHDEYDHHPSGLFLYLYAG